MGPRHSPLRWVSMPQVPPLAPFLASPLVTLYLSPFGHCHSRLCAGRRGHRHGPADPRTLPPPAAPRSHLMSIAEAEPDRLHTLVVGDDPLQGGCFLGLLYPSQVGTSVAGLALALRGQPSVPGHPQEAGGPRPCA